MYDGLTVLDSDHQSSLSVSNNRMYSELRDVTLKCSIRLPTDDSLEHIWIIGLDVSSTLSSCLAESYFDSDLVIALFYVQRRTDGHWITPHQDLPLTLHGEQLQVPMLLSHGSIILVGDHIFTYISHESLKPAASQDTLSQQSDTNSGIPPPKPLRHQRASVLKQDVLSRSQLNLFAALQDSDTMTSLTPVDIDIDQAANTSAEPKTLRIVYDEGRSTPDLEKSQEIFQSMRESVINNDVELLEHIETQEQMINVCVSYLLQFCMNNGLSMSAKNMDTMYRAMMTVCTQQPASLFDFISGMKSTEVVTDKDTGHFITLLNHAILICMDSLETSESCLKICTHLSADPHMVPCLLEKRTQTLVYACMSAYKQSVIIQTLACNFMQNVSSELKPQDGGMCPVREAGVDLISRALVSHSGEVKLLRHALRTILNVVRGHAINESEQVHVTKENGQNEHHDVDPQLQDDRASSMLDFIEQKILPLAIDLQNTHENQQDVCDMCSELMHFYAERDQSQHYELMQPGAQPSKSTAVAADESIYEEFNPMTTTTAKQTELGDTAEQRHDKPTDVTSDSERDEPVYSKVQKRQQTINDNSFQDIDLHENDVYETGQRRHDDVIESDSDASIGPELDYEARDRSLSCDVIAFDLPNPRAHLSERHLDDDDVLAPAAARPSRTASLQDIPGDAKRTKQGSQFTKKLGKYWRKLKPKKKKQKFSPHAAAQDFDAASSNSKTYVAFEHCDSDAEILKSVKPTVLSARVRPSPGGIAVLDSDLYEVAKSAGDDNETLFEQSAAHHVYEDITKYERKIHARSRVVGNVVSNEASVYDLAGPSPYDKSHDATLCPCDDTRDAGPSHNDVDVPTNNLPQMPELRSPHCDASISADDLTPNDDIPSHNDSTGSLDSYQPDAKDWEKISQSSEEVFVDDMSRDVSQNRSPDKDLNLPINPPNCDPPKELKTTSSLLDNVSLKSDEETTGSVGSRTDIHDDGATIPSIDSRTDVHDIDAGEKEGRRYSSHLAEPEDDHLSGDDDDDDVDDELMTYVYHDDQMPNDDDENDGEHVTECYDEIADEHMTGYKNHVIPEEGDDVDEHWSPQAAATDYGTLKRAKGGKKKGGWVSALKRIYETPQRKMSKMKNNVWRSRSMSNVTDDSSLPIENPKYSGNMRKATSTQSLQTTEKKSLRLPWKRRKSKDMKDVVVLPTSPSSDCLAAMANDDDVIIEEPDGVTSPLENYSSLLNNAATTSVKPGQSSESGYLTTPSISMETPPHTPKRSRHFPWKSKRKSVKL